MTNYKEEAEGFLSAFLSLREKKEALDRDLKLIEHKLSLAFAQGDLNHLKKQDSV